MDKEQEILDELKLLNQNLSKDFELRTNELQIQVDKTANEAELRKIADEEKKQEKLVADQEKAHAEVRAVQLEQFLDDFEVYLENEQVKDSDIHDEYVVSLNNLDNKLAVLVESTQATEEVEHTNEISYFADLSLLIFLLVAVPAVLTYKGLGSILDSAMA